MSDISEILNRSYTKPSLIIDGFNFGRGDLDTTTQLNLKCWRIVNEKLEEIKDKINHFYDDETYIIQWDSITNSLDKNENQIFFYWKGENASKGYSPLPEEIEKDNPPVERITQWSEPPAFLRLFSGTWMVHKGIVDDRARLYVLRGEIEPEVHFFEVAAKRASLRSRTSFILMVPRDEKVIIWHGNRSNSRNRDVVRKAVEKIFKYKIVEVEERSESEDFLKEVLEDDNDYYFEDNKGVMIHTPRLFYLNNITGSFLASEVDCSHRSEYNTPFPFLQAHLYTATQPATFLFDDNDEIWLWEGWQRVEDEAFRSECFSLTIQYAKQKSRLLGKLVKMHKVIAGFEPLLFTNLFPTWNYRQDIAELQKKDGAKQLNTNLLIEVTPEDNE